MTLNKLKNIFFWVALWVVFILNLIIGVCCGFYLHWVYTTGQM